MNNHKDDQVVEVDAVGLKCPMPLLKLKLALQSASDGWSVVVHADDRGSLLDIPRYINMTEYSCSVEENDSGVFVFTVVKSA